MATSSYQIPRQDFYDEDKQYQLVHGWAREALEEAEAYNRRQPAWSDIKDAMDVLLGVEKTDIPPELSHSYVNLLKRQMKEVVAVMSKVNPQWFYQSNSKQFIDVERHLNALLEDWWLRGNARSAIRSWVQYAAALGTGWIEPVWRKPRGRYGMGQIMLETHGPQSVSFVQLPNDSGFQRAYSGIITKEVPINLARQMFPAFADKLTPDIETTLPSRGGKAMNVIKRAGESLVHSMFGVDAGNRMDPQAVSPGVRVHFMYTIDNRMNESGQEVEMGVAGKSPVYKVPYWGQEIQTNVVDNSWRPGDGPKRYLTRKANDEDCLLYPLRRLTIFTKSAMMYDNTSPYWHGRFPAARLTLDRWLDDLLGHSLVKDGKGMQHDINETVRGFIDNVNRNLRPGFEYDSNGISDAEARKLDPRKPGLRVKTKPGYVGRAIKFLLPPEAYSIPQGTMEVLAWLSEAMEKVSSVNDMRNLAKARQIPSDATIDKILEIAGPVVEDMSAQMEESMKDIAEMVKSMFFQYYNAPRRLLARGDDGFSAETYDFDPDHIIPLEIRPTALREQTPEFKIIQEFCEGFPITVVPNSMHEITQTQHKLMMFQLWRDPTFPLGPYTMAKVFKMKNFGKPPDGKPTEIEQWEDFQLKLARIEGEKQAAMQAGLMQAMGPDAMAQMAAAGGGAPGGGGPPAGGGKPNGSGRPEGRPPTAQRPPHLEQKRDGRVLTSES